MISPRTTCALHGRKERPPGRWRWRSAEDAAPAAPEPEPELSALLGGGAPADDGRGRKPPPSPASTRAVPEIRCATQEGNGIRTRSRSSSGRLILVQIIEHDPGNRHPSNSLRQRKSRRCSPTGLRRYAPARAGSPRRQAGGGRTTKPPEEFWHTLTSSGIGNCFPVKELPGRPGGPITELAVTSHHEAFKALVDMLRDHLTQPSL